MVSKIIRKNRKCISYIIFIAVVLFSFYVLDTEAVFEKGGDIPSGQCSLISPSANVQELVCLEKNLRASSHTVLQGHIKHQNHSVHFGEGSECLSAEILVFFSVFISILGLYYFIINCSNRFVICFIHAKDGQKND